MYKLKHNDQEIEVHVEKGEKGNYTITINDRSYQISANRLSKHHIHAIVDGQSAQLYVAKNTTGKQVFLQGVSYQIEDTAKTKKRRGGGAATSGDVTPPMPGSIIRVHVKVGEVVAKGQKLVVMSAMKMETTLSSPYDGIVQKINVAEGDQVSPGQKLVEVEETKSESESES